MKLRIYFDKLKNATLHKEGLLKKTAGIALSATALATVLTACGQTQNVDTSDTPTTDTSAVETGGDLTETDVTWNEEAYQSYVADDTLMEDEWSQFIEDSYSMFSGKINNQDKKDFESAMILLNINALDEAGKGILLNHYKDGQDVERELDRLYSLLSQVREWNTEITSADDYVSFADVMLNENDQIILSALDDYAKEVITLRQNLTEENEARIQEIFNIVRDFVTGKGTIKVTIDGEEVDVAEIHLSRGAVFAAENVAQDISVLSRNIVSEEERTELDNQLRDQDALAATQTVMNTYLGAASAIFPGQNVDERNSIVETYNQGLAIITGELQEMGVTADEAKALYTLANIDFFMDSVNSQDAFADIYRDGFSINDMFKQAEEAVRKIQIHDDQSTEVYDMARLFMADEEDAISLRAFTNMAHGIVSTDASVVANTANTVKGYSQFSRDVTVNYQTTREDGTVETHSLDKRVLSKGAAQIANLYSFYSVMNNKPAYGRLADAIIPLVDGSQAGLDPYDQIVLEVQDYCVRNNIVAFDYEMGATK